MRHLMRLIVALGSLAAFASLAHSGWNPDGVTIKATTLALTDVDACSDGEFGTFVVWQENDQARIQHVLPSGDVDPSWPAAGAMVCSEPTPRSMLEVMPDGLGGAYVWWLEERALYLSRITNDGTTAAAWPPRGRLLGTLSEAACKPSVIEDGAHGIYAGWVEDAFFAPDPFRVFGIHLGPTNMGAGGWPNAPRSLVPSYDFAIAKLGPSLALAADGGLFVGWATYALDAGADLPNAFRISRRTAAGALQSGWPTDGIEVAENRGGFDWSPSPASPIAIDRDGNGGIYVAVANPEDPGHSQGYAFHVLYRRQSDGSNAVGWPVLGRQFNYAYWASDVPDTEMRVEWDGADGAIAGGPNFPTDSPAMVELRHVTASSIAGIRSATASGMEFVQAPPRGVFVSDFDCCGPESMFDWGAFISVDGPATSLFEWHDEVLAYWFPGAGLAPSGDGGAVFFWSQVNQRYGLFARRFGPAGEVVDVAASPTGLAIRSLRFVPGLGIRATVSITESSGACIEVFDLAGRRIARSDLPAPGASRELSIAGTVALPSGLYLARLTAGPKMISRKVMVAR